MEHDRGTWVQRILAVSLAVILVLLPVHAFISTWGGTTIGPLEIWKSWKELFLIALLPFILAYLHMRPDIAKKVSDSWVTRFIFLYVLLNVGYAAISVASHEAIAAGLLMNLRFPAIMVLAMIVAACNDNWTRKFKGLLEPWLFGVTIFLSVVAIAQVAIIPKDFLAQFGYGDSTIAPYSSVDNTSTLRAFATMRGPNTLAAYLILPLILALLALIREPKNIWAGLSVGLGAVALAMTSSRSAWVGLVAAFFVLVMLSEPAKKFIRGFAWLVVPLVCLGFIFLWVAANVPSLRLAVFHSSTGDLSLTEGSIDKHWQATVNGARDVVDHPLGKGVGTAGPASFYNDDTGPNIPENYFVQIAQEMGVIGLGLFIALCVAVGRKLWQQRHQVWPRVLFASFIGLSVVNLFLHGWSDDPTAMTWWGIAGLYMLGVPDDTLKKIAKVKGS